MLKINKIITMFVVLLTVGFAYAWGEEPESLEVKQETGYRIEVDTALTEDGMPIIEERAKEIKFLSPKGKIVKTLPYDHQKNWGRIFIAPTFKYLIKAEDIPAEWRKDSLGRPIKIKEARLKFSYINARGEEKWEKELGIIHTLAETSEEMREPFYFKIARDGSKIVLVNMFPSSDYYDYADVVIVYDTLGNELASIPLQTVVSNVRISPDGKIIGAEMTILEKAILKGSRYLYGKHFFFLDVETGRTKIVRAEWEGWRAEFSLPPEGGTPPGKVGIAWGIYADPECKKWIKSGYTFLTFEEIPDDLTTLFKQGGEK